MIVLGIIFSILLGIASGVPPLLLGAVAGSRLASMSSGAAGPALHRFEHIRLLAIDPGHGGDNRGCLGVDGTYEKTLTLILANRVASILRAETNLNVRLTRHDDHALGLRERTELANGWGADLFLSLHLNADKKGRGVGVETWFLSEESADAQAVAILAREEAEDLQEPPPEVFEADQVVRIIHDAELRAAQTASEPLAGAIVKALAKATGAKSRGVRQAAFGVLKHAKMPAIVVECGFFSHAKEGLRLMDADYQERVARGVVMGLIAYDQAMGGSKTP